MNGLRTRWIMKMNDSNSPPQTAEEQMLMPATFFPKRKKLSRPKTRLMQQNRSTTPANPTTIPCIGFFNAVPVQTGRPATRGTVTVSRSPIIQMICAGIRSIRNRSCILLSFKIQMSSQFPAMQSVEKKSNHADHDHGKTNIGRRRQEPGQ